MGSGWWARPTFSQILGGSRPPPTFHSQRAVGEIVLCFSQLDYKTEFTVRQELICLPRGWSSSVKAAPAGCPAPRQRAMQADLDQTATGKLVQLVETNKFPRSSLVQLGLDNALSPAGVPERAGFPAGRQRAI